jgi:hypothetical protein
MIDEYLTKTFKGQSIVNLVEFLYGLDNKYDWKGGVINEGLSFDYPENIEYIIIYETSLNVALLVKCQVIYHSSLKHFVVPLMDGMMPNFDMIIETIGGLNYENGAFNLNDLAIELHGTTVY